MSDMLQLVDISTLETLNSQVGLNTKTRRHKDTKGYQKEKGFFHGSGSLCLRDFVTWCLVLLSKFRLRNSSGEKIFC